MFGDDGNVGSEVRGLGSSKDHEADTATSNVVELLSDERAPKRLKVPPFGTLRDSVDHAVPDCILLQASVRLLRGCDGVDEADAERFFDTVWRRLQVERDEQIISVLVCPTKGLRQQLRAA